MSSLPVVTGTEHWATKHDGEPVRLFLWEKCVGSPDGKPVIFFVHGSSMASTPAFDLQVPGMPHMSVMDWFARQGFVCWTMDHEGYGRSEKSRGRDATIAEGADDLAAATDFIMTTRGVKKFLMYGISSGALRAALFAQRHPERVARLALDAFVWTGAGSPTLEQRRKKLPELMKTKRRPIDRAFLYTIFERDHPGCTPTEMIEPFIEATLALDDSMPNGTYFDMCHNLPVVDPALLTVPTLIMRGQWDGIAGIDDLVDFFKRLPNADKQFAVMPGVAHSSMQSKNWQIPFHLLHGFFAQPAPVYTGENEH